MKCFDTSSLAAVTALSLSGAASAGTVRWEFQGIEDVECVAPMGDLDGDGIPESALMHYDSGASGQEFLTVIRGSSQGRADVLWSTQPWGGISGGGGYGDRCLDTVADLDEDGHRDLLLGTAWGSRSAFHISGLQGSVLAIHDSYEDAETGWCYQVSSIGDVNQDDLPETAAAFGNDSRSVFLLDGASRGDTDELWHYQLQRDGFNAVIGPGDLSGDLVPDVVASSGGNGIDNRVVALSGVPAAGSTPEVLWSFETDGLVYSVATLPDLDQDGAAEIVSGSWLGEGLVRLHRGATGEVIWSHFVGHSVMQVIDASDINGDGAHEVAVASWDNAVRLLDGRSGELLWRSAMGDDVWRTAAAGDLDGDGISDLLAGSFDHRVAAFSGVDGHLLWDHDTGAKVFSVRATPDVTGDGIDDVLCGTQMLSGVGGKAFAIEGDSQGPWIDVEVKNLTPSVAPGGQVRLRITATNQTRSRRPFDCWVGSNILATDLDVLAPGETRSAVATGTVPAGAPVGRRTLAIEVGWTKGGTWDRATFRIEIEGAALASTAQPLQLSPWSLESRPEWSETGAPTAPADLGRRDRERALIATGLATGLDANAILRIRAHEPRR